MLALRKIHNRVNVPERQCLHGVTETADLATTRLVIITTTVDHNLLELEVVHVFDVDFRRRCRHFWTFTATIQRRKLYKASLRRTHTTSRECTLTSQA